jgi:uncharacterized protein YjiS (DUF1127 family)
MSHALRHQHEPQPTVLRSSGDYIIRSHLFTDEPPSRRSGATATIALWRQHYLTRRHLAALDGRGLADIGLDREARDREVAKPFWKL